MTSPPHRTIYARQAKTGHAYLFFQSVEETLDYTVVFDDVPTGATGFALNTVTVGEYVHATSLVDTSVPNITVTLATGTSSLGDRQMITVRASYTIDAAANINEVPFTIETRAATAW